MIAAGIASWATSTYYGGKAGMVVLLVLLAANVIASELGRHRGPRDT